MALNPARARLQGRRATRPPARPSSPSHPSKALHYVRIFIHRAMCTPASPLCVQVRRLSMARATSPSPHALRTSPDNRGSSSSRRSKPPQPSPRQPSQQQPAQQQPSGRRARGHRMPPDSRHSRRPAACARSRDRRRRSRRRPASPSAIWRRLASLSVCTTSGTGTRSLYNCILQNFDRTVRVVHVCSSRRASAT